MVRKTALDFCRRICKLDPPACLFQSLFQCTPSVLNDRLCTGLWHIGTMKVFSVLKVGTQNGAPALLCEQVDQGIFQPTTKTPDVQWLSCTINRFAQCVLSKCNSSDVSSVASPTASVKASERVVVPRMPRTTAFMVLADKKKVIHLTG